ncbi:MAG: ArnT family glycosyltransferase [bacterium]
MAVFLIVAAGIGGPGITIDEPLDVAPGRHYWDVLSSRGTDFFSSSGVKQAFGGNPDHPPLVRWCLGASSYLFQTFQAMVLGHGDPTGLYILSARMASALAFAVTVSLVVAWSSKQSGLLAGWCAGLALLCMPRLFGHAHLAALETILNLFATAAILAWVDLLADDERNSPKYFLKPALMLALALLCKIQAWLLGIWLVVLLACWRPSPRKLLLSVSSGMASVVLWFVGWPWLWYESADRIREYFFRSVDRISLKVMYFGQVFEDRALPWHFIPLQVATAITPAIWILIFFGVLQTFSKTNEMGIHRRKQLGLMAAVLTVLCIFSLPVARYDGDRLVLMVYPTLAIFAGSGATLVQKKIQNYGRRGFATPLIVLVYVVSALPLLKPFPLSYSNFLVGGTSGATARGLEPTYWADSVDKTLLEELMKQVKPGDSVALVPTLHGTQAVMTTPYEMLIKGQVVKDQAAWNEADYLLVYRREAYWPEGVAEWVKTHEPIKLRSRDGVWLAGLWRGPGHKSP